MMFSIDKAALWIIGWAYSLFLVPEGWLLDWRQLLSPLPALVLLLIVIISLNYISPRNLLPLAVMFCLPFYFHGQALSLLQLARLPENFGAEVQLDFRIETILSQGDYQRLIVLSEPRPGLPAQRIYLHWNLKQSVQSGELWRGYLRLKPVAARLNQGGFDRQKWFFANGISATARVKNAFRLEQNLSLRHRYLQDAQKKTQGLAQQGLLLALGFGERSRMAEATLQLFRHTNTAHLIAISGLHIGLAMLIGVAAGRCLQFCLPSAWIRPLPPLICGLTLAATYAWLAGFSLPTQRALLALLCLYGLRLYRADCGSWRLFLRVIGLLLLFDPLAVLSQSFWLSVGAVACLLLWYRVCPLNLFEWRGQPLREGIRRFLAPFHLQLGLVCLFTPIQVLVFGTFAVYGLWANLLMVPLYGLILVPIILFAVLTGGALMSWQLADSLAQRTIALLQVWDRAAPALTEREVMLITLSCSFIFCLLLYGLYGRKRRTPPLLIRRPKTIHLKFERSLPKREFSSLLMGGVGLMLYCVWTLLRAEANPAQWRLETLDVGQGQATLIVKNQAALLYDTGAAWATGSMARTEIIPYLQRQGIRLELLILSHDDNDHAGGAAHILQRYPELAVMQASKKNYAKNNRTFCLAGQEWQWRGLRFRSLSPHSTPLRARNTDSCVLLIEDGRHRILLTGDADLAAERRFLSGLGKIDVLQVGHHGSRTSTGRALLAETRPHIALISAGAYNRWRFPHTEVIENLKEYGSRIYNTADSGQISLLFYSDKWLSQTARSAQSPWYRQKITVKTAGDLDN